MNPLSLISNWTDAQCRDVLDQLLAEEKGRCCQVTKMPAGVCFASLSRYADYQTKNFTDSLEAQAWLDQQWRDYVEAMKPL